MSLLTPGFGLQAFRNVKLNFCCLKPPGLGNFVTVATGSKYAHDVDITLSTVYR